MPEKFDLTANINARLANGKIIADEIKRKLAVTVPIKVRFDANATQNVSQMTAAMKGLNAQMVALNANSKLTAASIQNLAKAFGSVGQKSTGLTRVAKEAKVADKAVKEVTNNVGEFGRVAGLALRRNAGFILATAGIYGLGRAITSSFSEAIRFEKELVKVAQVSGRSVSSLKPLTSEISRLATGLGVASEELIDISLVLAQAGLSANETRQALDALARTTLAATFGDIEDTTEGAIALMSQFGISAAELSKALGSVNAVAAAFAVESEDIIAAVKRAGGVFAQTSQGLEQGPLETFNQFIATFSAVRATTRESAESIATGIRTIFTRIQRPQTIQFLKELGINLTDLEGKFVGPFEAVERLSRGLANVDRRGSTFARVSEELGGFRQIGKTLALLASAEQRSRAFVVAQTGQNSLLRDSEQAQQSLANAIAKTAENFTALIREISQTKTFDAIVRSVLALSNGMVELARAIKPALPLITAIAAVQGLRIGRAFLPEFKRGLGLKKARGGTITGGRGGIDDVPAMLTAGEFVINKKAAQIIGRGTLDKLNKVDRIGFAKGGVVGYTSGGNVTSSGIDLSKLFSGKAVAPIEINLKVRDVRGQVVDTKTVSGSSGEEVVAQISRNQQSNLLPPGRNIRKSRLTQGDIDAFRNQVGAGLGPSPGTPNLIIDLPGEAEEKISRAIEKGFAPNRLQFIAQSEKQALRRRLDSTDVILPNNPALARTVFNKRTFIQPDNRTALTGSSAVPGVLSGLTQAQLAEADRKARIAAGGQLSLFDTVAVSQPRAKTRRDLDEELLASIAQRPRDISLRNKIPTVATQTQLRLFGLSPEEDLARTFSNPPASSLPRTRFGRVGQFFRGAATGIGRSATFNLARDLASTTRERSPILNAFLGQRGVQGQSTLFSKAGQFVKSRRFTSIGAGALLAGGAILGDKIGGATGGAISGLAGGGAAGFGLGSLFGPVGAAVGAAVGGIIGAFNGFVQAGLDERIKNASDNIIESLGKVETSFTEFQSTLSKTGDIKKAVNDFNKGFTNLTQDVINMSRVDIGESTTDLQRSRLAASSIRSGAERRFFAGVDNTARKELFDAEKQVLTVFGNRRSDLEKTGSQAQQVLFEQLNRGISFDDAIKNLDKGAIVALATSSARTQEEKIALGQAFASGDKGLVETVARAQVSGGATRQLAQEEIKRIKLLKDSQVALSQVNNQTDLFVERLETLSSVFDRVSTEGEKFARQNNALLSRRSGGAGIVSQQIRNVFGNIRGFTSDEVGASAQRLNLLLGNSINSRELTGAAFGAKQAQIKLPSILNKLNQAVSVSGGGEARTLLPDLINKNLGLLPETLRTKLISDIDNKFFANEQASPDDLRIALAGGEASDIAKQLTQPIIDANNKAVEVLNSAISDYERALDTWIGLQEEANRASDNRVKIEIDNANIEKQILGQNRLTVADKSRGFITQLNQFGNRAGLRNFDINRLAAQENALNNARNNITGSPDQVAREMANIALAQRNAQQALELIASNTDRQVALQDELNSLVDSRRAFRQLAEDFAFGSPEDRIRIERQITLARTQAAGGQILSSQLADARAGQQLLSTIVGATQGPEAVQRLDKQFINALDRTDAARLFGLAGVNPGVGVGGLLNNRDPVFQNQFRQLQGVNREQAAAAGVLAGINQRDADQFAQTAQQQFLAVFQGLQTALANGGLLDRLNNTLSQLPSEIRLKVEKFDVNLNITGGELLGAITPQIEQLVSSKLEQAISRVIPQEGPSARVGGVTPLRNA